jgi:hypothetical protein
MARIRSVKPEFSTDARLARCTDSARLLYILLWVYSDDQGIHREDALELRLEAFPADKKTDEQVQGFMDELIREGMVYVFKVPADAGANFETVAGESFWLVKHWDRHQRIDRPNSKYPAIRDLWEKRTGHRRRAEFGEEAGMTTRPAHSAPPSANGDHWQAADAMARRFNGLRMADKPQDKTLVRKTCWLVAAGKIPPDWLETCLELLQKDRRRNPPSFFTFKMKELAAAARPPQDFRRLLAETPEPPPRDTIADSPDIGRPAARQPEDPRSATNRRANVRQQLKKTARSK